MMQEIRQPYFPPLYGDVDCGMCDIAAECWCCGEYQRNRRDFSHSSGRCPRLPDKKGFVEKEYRKLYAESFPLAHAERGGDDTLYLTLTTPHEKRPKKVYMTKSGYWYFRERGEGGAYSRRRLDFNMFQSKQEVLTYMERFHADYCIFQAVIEDFCV